MRPCELPKGLDMLLDGAEELVAALDLNRLRAAVIDQPPCLVLDVSVHGPIRREPAGGRAVQRSTQGSVPSRRPAADDEAEFVEDAIQEAVELRGIRIEFRLGVPDPRVKVVAVQLDHAATRVDQRQRAL